MMAIARHFCLTKKATEHMTGCRCRHHQLASLTVAVAVAVAVAMVALQRTNIVKARKKRE